MRLVNIAMSFFRLVVKPREGEKVILRYEGCAEHRSDSGVRHDPTFDDAFSAEERGTPKKSKTLDDVGYAI